MTSVNYTQIFEMFLGNITDYNFANLSTSDSYTLMTEYLHKAIAETYLRRIFSSIKLDDEVQNISFVLKYSTEDDEVDFVINAIAKWMVYEWLQKQVRSVDLTAQFFGGKEQKYYSQSAHLSELRGLMDDAYKEARFFIGDRGYINNSYLGDT